MKPILINDLSDKNDLITKFSPAEIIDLYEEQAKELFLIRNPRYRFDPNYSEELDKFKAELSSHKRWVFFPWNKTLISCLTDEMHQELRTARNRNLITKEQQEKFYNFPVAIAGLSVGSHPAMVISMMGGARDIRIADPDEISASNTNRIRTDFSKLGKSKCDEVEHAIYQLNPYAEVSAYPAGITPESIEEFLTKGQKVGVLVEEVDNLFLKIMLRLKAKQLGIPVVMATDNGDGVIIDIERYDLEPELELFNGAIGHVSEEEFKKFQPQDLPKLATKVAGPNVASPEMLKSVLEVGRTIYSWPQLGDAANSAGSVVAYLVRRLALGLPLKSGKYEVNLDAIFDPDYFSKDFIEARENLRKDCLDKLGL